MNVVQSKMGSGRSLDIVGCVLKRLRQLGSWSGAEVWNPHVSGGFAVLERQVAINPWDIMTAINILTAFINQLQAESGKHVLSSCSVGGTTSDPAAALISDARSLINSLTISPTANTITGSVLTASGLGLGGRQSP